MKLLGSLFLGKRFKTSGFVGLKPWFWARRFWHMPLSCCCCCRTGNSGHLWDCSLKASAQIHLLFEPLIFFSINSYFLNFPPSFVHPVFVFFSTRMKFITATISKMNELACLYCKSGLDCFIFWGKNVNKSDLYHSRSHSLSLSLVLLLGGGFVHPSFPKKYRTRHLEFIYFF